MPRAKLCTETAFAVVRGQRVWRGQLAHGVGKIGVPVWTPLPLAEWHRLLNRHRHSGDLSYIHLQASVVSKSVPLYHSISNRRTDVRTSKESSSTKTVFFLQSSPSSGRRLLALETSTEPSEKAVFSTWEPIARWTLILFRRESLYLVWYSGGRDFFSFLANRDPLFCSWGRSKKEINATLLPKRERTNERNGRVRMGDVLKEQ